MKLKDVKLIYKGKYLSYYVAEYINNDGDIKEYEFISRNPNVNVDNFGKNTAAGVGLVPFNMNKDKVLLQSEFRLATNRYVYNFPAGLIDEGESAFEAAKRELKEETGVDLVEVIAILSPSYASQGTSDELMQIVICKCKGEVRPSCYVNEEINAKWYTKEEIKKLLDEGAYMSVRTQMFLWQWVNTK